MPGGSLTVQQAADLLGMDRARIQAATRQHRLAAVRHGQTWQVLLDTDGRLIYRADRLKPEWRHDRVLHIGSLATPWPDAIAARLGTDAVEAAATPRERELLTLLEQERRDREFDRMAAHSRVEDAQIEVARLRAQLDDERRRRELAMREHLLSLAALIPPAEPAEWQRLGLPAR
jgi:excisionase family DNA binding protein